MFVNKIYVPILYIWMAAITQAITSGMNASLENTNVTCTILNMCDASVVRVTFLQNSARLNLEQADLLKLTGPYCPTANKFFGTDQENSCFGNLNMDAFRTHNVLLSIVHLLKDWRCKSALFVIDGTSGFNTPMSIINMAVQVNIIDIRILYVDDNLESLDSALRNISRNQKNIVVMCRENITDAIITSANKSGLITRPIFWIFVGTQIPESLYQLGSEIATQVVLLKPSVVTGNQKIPFAGRSERKSNFSLNCSNDELNENHTNVGHFESIDILVEMNEIFFSETTKQLESIYFAKWNIAEGLQYREIITDDGGKGRMRGYRMKTISYIDPPHLFFIKRNTTMVGYQLEIARAVSEYMNFLLDVPLTHEKKTGVQIGKGNWIGLVGRVYRREIDFGTAVVGRTKTRAQVVLYSYYTGEGSMSILLMRPTEEEMKFGAYLQPFTYKVWVYVTGIQTLLYLCYLMARFFCNTYLPDTNRENDPLQRENKIWALASGSVLIEDVVSNTFPSASAKVLFGVFLLVLEVCFDYYTSIFTSFLTVYTVKMPFETLEQLMDSDYTIGVVNGTSHHDIIKSADHGLYAKVWERINSFGNRDVPTDKADAIKQVTQRKFAVLVEGPTTLALVHSNCTYMFGKRKYVVEPYSMPVRKDLPMQKAFSMSILKLHEHGIKKKLMKYYTPPEMKYCEQNTGFVQMGIPHVVSLFILLAFGIAMSLIILITEIILSKFAVCVSHTKTKNKLNGDEADNVKDPKRSNVHIVKLKNMFI